MSIFLKYSSFVLRINNYGNPIIQSVRYRKPLWLPVAPSKEFYVRKPTPIDPVEQEILRTKYMHYRTKMKAIRAYLKTELSKNKTSKVTKKELDEASAFNWMKEQTLAWNTEIGVSREERQLAETLQEEERLRKVMEAKAEQELQQSLAAQEVVAQNKMASQNFVTEENMDIEIEKMLDSRSDYNFGVTQDGGVFEGEYPDRLQR